MFEVTWISYDMNFESQELEAQVHCTEYTNITEAMEDYQQKKNDYEVHSVKISAVLEEFNSNHN